MNKVKSRVRIPSFLVLMAMFVFAATAVHAQGTGMQATEDAPLSGTVVDSTTQQPVSDIQIEIEGTEMSAQTDDEGNFNFNDIDPGTYTLVVQADGYQEVSKEVAVTGQPNEITLRLQPANATSPTGATNPTSDPTTG